MELKHYAKALRSNMTEAERHLWYHLRGHRFLGLKFKRQKPMGHYIVDFICIERRLVIELDGGQHQQQAVWDAERDRWLMEQGYRVLRFWNHEVLGETDSVLEAIRRAVIDVG
ncbi:endonuclease domain-containing protein [Pseudomonas sp. Q1-7]|uniref:endonuclease domain-containing protein n=1 Tax=Pseudomonas sp. Q1-7 TaxID=3020843 RepID=UPI002300BCEC|nr:endonuclease domain-containing protein [Pseudomonas sp. Q1-7]